MIRVTPENTKTIRHRFLDRHLPRIKSVHEHGVPVKRPSPRQSKRNAAPFLPPIARSTSNGSSLANNVASTTSLETIPSPSPAPPPVTCNSVVQEAAQRFILRNNMVKLSRDFRAVHVTHSFHPKRSTRYGHIQAKINTGLSRIDNKESPEPDTHQLEPSRPMNWSGLKADLEQDIHIRAQSKRIQFNAGVTYATQLTSLGNLVRSKIKSHLLSITGSGDERYKIVVHLTVFPTTAGGLHVASRCLWNPNTDNSITIKMQGLDCDILIVTYLCYTDLGAI